MEQIDITCGGGGGFVGRFDAEEARDGQIGPALGAAMPVSIETTAGDGLVDWEEWGDLELIPDVAWTPGIRFRPRSWS